MKAGPNDVLRHVVWAISMFFYISYFLYTNYFLLLYLGTVNVRVVEDNTNGPKRHVQTRRLRHKYFFNLYFVFYIY